MVTKRRKAEKPAAKPARRPRSSTARLATPSIATQDQITSIVDRVTMATVRLRRLSAQVSTTAFDAFPQDVHVDMGFTRPQVDQRGDALRIETVFSIQFRDDADFRALIELTTEVLYRKKNATDEFQAEAVDHFARVNFPFNAWGYWREAVQSCLVRMGLPPIALPLLLVREIPTLMRDS